MPEKLVEKQIDDLLHHNITGRIGCCDKNKMYIVPINYAFDGKFIFAHSKEGLKIDMMRRNEKVCFQTDIIETSGSWKSVVLWGNYEEIKAVRGQVAVMRIFIKKMARLTQNDSEMPTHGFVRGEMKEKDPFKAVVFRIRITEKTGMSYLAPGEKQERHLRFEIVGRKNS